MYSSMDKRKFEEGGSLLKIWSDAVYLNRPLRPYRFKFFKGCLLQILIGPFLSILSHFLMALVVKHIRSLNFALRPAQENDHTITTIS